MAYENSSSCSLEEKEGTDLPGGLFWLVMQFGVCITLPGAPSFRVFGLLFDTHCLHQVSHSPPSSPIPFPLRTDAPDLLLLSWVSHQGRTCLGGGLRVVEDTAHWLKAHFRQKRQDGKGEGEETERKPWRGGGRQWQRIGGRKGLETSRLTTHPPISTACGATPQPRFTGSVFTDL